MNNLAEKLRVARKVNGLTQVDAAYETGFSSKAFYNWEHGSRPHPLHRQILEEAIDRWLREAAQM